MPPYAMIVVIVVVVVVVVAMGTNANKCHVIIKEDSWMRGEERRGNGEQVPVGKSVP